MRTIYKYPAAVDDHFSLRMPKDAVILTLQTQHGKPYIWALVDTEAEAEPRSFRLYGTGHPVNEDLDQKYVGTYQLNNGGLVFHLFEVDACS